MPMMMVMAAVHKHENISIHEAGAETRRGLLRVAWVRLAKMWFFPLELFGTNVPSRVYLLSSPPVLP
jgi:hypothetical protein